MDYETFASQHFNGNASAIAREFGITHGAVNYWKKNGIPPLRQAQLELWLLRKSSLPASKTAARLPRTRGSRVSGS